MATYSRNYVPAGGLDFGALTAQIPDSDELKRAVNVDPAIGADIDGVNVVPDAAPARVDFVRGGAFSGPEQAAIDAVCAAHTGADPLATGGTRPMGGAEARVPNTSDDEAHGFSYGSIFINTATSRAFLCTDPATGAAVWQDVGNAFTGGAQVKVTANDTTADYLKTKLVAGTDIALVEVDDALNETLRVDWTGSGSGITAGAHNALRQLIHFIDEGPTDGFASGSFKEVTRTGAKIDSEIWYVDNTKAEKIVSYEVMAWSGIFPLTEIWKMYDSDGTTVLVTLTDAITYSGAFEATRTRTWA